MKIYPVDSLFGLCQKHNISFEKINGMILLQQNDFKLIMHPQTNFGNALRIIVDKFCLGESEYERLMNAGESKENQLSMF
jgi:hypothetical protein